ncbi:MAG: SDR family oxidoreductase [Candidatus Aenigmarchaeota archaeon]|nr:SDR family oxidoreductase [Candidatus Aenigmarchaeota archaeon]
MIENKVVVITGSSSGLGMEMAKVLSTKNNKIIICSRDESGLKNVCEEIAQKGGKCSYYKVDVTNRLQVSEFINKILKSDGKIDILINNAGYASRLNKLEDISYEDLEKNFETNIYSIFSILKCVVPAMKKQKNGMIINVSSMAGKRGVPNLSAYSASKFAVVGLTQSLAKELKDTNILSITLCPGGMNTPMRAKLFGLEEAQKQQDTRFVAEVVRDIIVNKIKVPNGGDVIVRRGKISVNPCPYD